MGSIPESTINILLSGLMGVLGGLITLPLNALVSWQLKREEQLYKHKLEVIAKRRELLLQHKLEMERKSKDDEIENLKTTIEKLEQKLNK